MMLLYNDAVFGGVPKTPQAAPRLREDLSIRVYAEGRCYFVRLEFAEDETTEIREQAALPYDDPDRRD